MSGSRGRGDHRTRVGKERSARTERRILEAALGVFAERGPDAPVIDELVQAAGVARGTFYNYFDNVEELLAATSEWTTREHVQRIEQAIDRVDGATLRLGVGLRLFLAQARQNLVWCRFVARVWKVGWLERPMRDIDAGIRAGHFRVPSRAVARALVCGGVRAALERIGEGGVAAAFGQQMAEMLLHALRADSRRIAEALAHELPTLPEGAKGRG